MGTVSMSIPTERPAQAARPARRLKALARRLGWPDRHRRAIQEGLSALEPALRSRTLREIEWGAEPDGPPGWAWAAATRLRRWAAKEGYGDLHTDPHSLPDEADPVGRRPSREPPTELAVPPLECWLGLLEHFAGEPEAGEVEDLLVGWMDVRFIDPFDLSRTLSEHLTLLHLRDPDARL